MAIKRDLSALPTPRKARKQGWAPDPAPEYGQLLVEALHDKRGPLERARPEARFRHSDAAACSRLVAYAAMDLEPSNPMDQAGSFVTEQGHSLHEQWQNEMEAQYGDQVEVEVICGAGEFAGHIDAVLRLVPTGSAYEETYHDPSEELVISIEAKSVGGYTYQLAVGARGAAEGPRWSAIVQAALNAAAVDADGAKVIYWGRDAISVQMAARKNIDEVGRVCAEWTMDRATFEPIATKERERVEAVLELLDEGVLPARKIPDPDLPLRHLIVEPRDGSWVEQNAEGAVVDAGSTWHCAYCRYQDLCANTPAGRTLISEVPALNMEEDR
jgi:hypothetical protein